MNSRAITSSKSIPYKKVKLWVRIKPYMPFYIMLFPVLLYYLIFSYAPLGGIIIAFKNYTFMDGIWGSAWAGLTHFKRFFMNGDFTLVFSNTIIISVLRLVFAFPAPIIFALLLYEMKFTRVKKLIQTVSYLPHFISWVVVYGLMYNLFSSSGFINQIIMALGGESIPFLAKQEYFRALYVGSAMWKEIGWSAIIYLAALSGVDPQLHEAAEIDGANRWQQMWYITLPSIRNVVSIMFVLSCGNILNVGFEQILVMYNSTVSDVAEVLDYYVYRVGLLQANNYSYATAVGLFKSVFSLILVIFTNSVAKKIDEEGSIW